MQSDNPLLSVLVPVYNAEKYISSCIKSLLVQTYDRIQILICDDGSTDSTWSIINDFCDKRISVFRNSVNIGKIKTCSFLLGRSEGEFITIHDADDISASTRFELQITFLTKNPDYAMCGTNFTSFLDNGIVIRKSNLATECEQIRRSIRTTSQFHGPTIVFKRLVLAEVGGLYRYFTHGEDIDLTMRIAEKFKVANLPAHLYFYRHQPSSLTNNISGYGIERLAHFSLLYYLADERRRNNGLDSLMTGDIEHVKQVVDAFKKEYEGDPEIALRRGAFRLLHMRMYRNAITLSCLALFRNWSMLNVKCLLYTMWKSLKGFSQLFLIREKIDLSFLR